MLSNVTSCVCLPFLLLDPPPLLYSSISSTLCVQSVTVHRHRSAGSVSKEGTFHVLLSATVPFFCFPHLKLSLGIPSLRFPVFFWSDPFRSVPASFSSSSSSASASAVVQSCLLCWCAYGFSHPSSSSSVAECLLACLLPAVQSHLLDLDDKSFF